MVRKCQLVSDLNDISVSKVVFDHLPLVNTGNLELGQYRNKHSIYSVDKIKTQHTLFDIFGISWLVIIVYASALVTCMSIIRSPMCVLLEQLRFIGNYIYHYIYQESKRNTYDKTRVY